MTVLTPNQTKRRMPSERAIREHWVDRLWEIKGYDSEYEFLEDGVCFACGFEWPLERAHITARVEGGDDSLENLHMLCSICHKDSEYLSGDRYAEWLESRTIYDAMASVAIRRGFNFTQLVEISNKAKAEYVTKSN